MKQSSAQQLLLLYNLGAVADAGADVVANAVDADTFAVDVAVADSCTTPELSRDYHETLASQP